MQYLKEDIREAIIKSALEEFSSKNYKNASMRTIAQNAGITVGNIYRYFKNKDEMFSYITDPVWKEVQRVIFSDFEYHGQKGSPNIPDIIATIMEIYKVRNKEVFILLHNSDGSKYANVKSDLASLIATRIKEEMAQIPNIYVEDEFIYKIISNSVVESVYIIMKECGNNFNRVQNLIEKTVTILIEDLHTRI